MKMSRELLLEFYKELDNIFKFICEVMLEIPEEDLEYKQDYMSEEEEFEEFFNDDLVEWVGYFDRYLTDFKDSVYSIYNIYYSIGEDRSIQLYSVEEDSERSKYINDFYIIVSRLGEPLRAVYSSSPIKSLGIYEVMYILPRATTLEFLREFNRSPIDLKKMILTAI